MNSSLPTPSCHTKNLRRFPQPTLFPETYETCSQTPALILKLLHLPGKRLRVRVPSTEFIAWKLENFTPTSISRESVWLFVNEPWCLAASKRTLSEEQKKGQSEVTLSGYGVGGRGLTWVGRRFLI